MPKNLFLVSLSLIPLLCAYSPEADAAKPGFVLTSPAFKDGAALPGRFAYHGEGQNASPPLAWSNPPSGTKSYALVTVDPHPVAHNWVHWLVIDIPPGQRTLAEGSSGTPKMPGHELLSSFHEKGWGGPLPPVGSGVHPYETTIYALSVAKLGLPEKTTLPEFESAIRGKVLAQSKLTGTYQR